MTHQLELKRPHNDHKEYRRIVLENGLICLLVCDHKTDKSAAGLTVLTGSYDDPDDLKGLAHFLEHMLFMGSKEYPRQNEYSEYIESNGGSSNAYTSDNSTFYYFDIPNDCFENSLDIFGHFFISPLFTRELVDREMCAVNSEYMIDLQSDSWRFNMLQRSLSNPSHPYHKFGIGNLETLKTEQTVDRLIKFYDTMYSSDIMYLVVISNKSLDHSEHTVREIFEQVPNKNLRHGLKTKIPDSIKPFDPPYSGKLVYMRPIKETNSLLICYQLPSLLKYYRSKPDNILAHLIGHEGQGSILESMKRMGYAESLCAGADVGINTFTTFRISIDLTLKGLENIPECVRMVDQYIDMLKRVGCDKKMCNEQRNLNALQFDQLDDNDAVAQVETLANNITMYEPDDVLSGPYLIDEPTDTVIHMINNMLKDYFCPENRNIYIISHTFPHELFGKSPNDWDVIKRQEMWLHSEYYMTNCDEVKEFNHLTEKDYKFHIPKPNPFVPENLSILPLKPILIRKDPDQEIWYKPDTKFNKPICCLDQFLYSPWIQSNPYTCEIMTGIITEELNSCTYDASLVDLQFSISTHEKQMVSIHCSGYSDKFMILLNIITDQLFAQYETVTDELLTLFRTVKDKILRKLRNRKLENVSSQIRDTLYNISNERYIELDREIDAINTITIDDVIRFKTYWYKSMYCKYLMQGNCYEKMVLDHADRVKSLAQHNEIGAQNNNHKKIKYVPSHVIQSYKPQPQKMLSSRNITIVVRSNDPNNVCSGFLQYHIIDHINLEKLAALKILGHLINEPFFDQLRTNEQLGYDVYGDMYPLDKIYGLCLRVISDTKDPNYLKNRTDSFMRGMENRLTSMTTEQYEENIQGIITNILEIDTKLFDEFGRNSREIMMGRYAFNSREQLAKQIEMTSLDNVIDLYHQIMRCPNSLMIMVHPMNSEVIESIPKLEFADIPFVFDSMM